MSYPFRGLIPQPYHHMMLINQPRMAAFKQAIARRVGPDDVVVEAGSGTGVLSALAAQRARHVYALELNPDLVASSRRMLALNGLEHKVTVIEGPAEDFTPPEPVSVVICEMLHVGLVNEQQVRVMRGLLAKIAARQDISALTVIPYAAVNAVQLMHVDYRYEGLTIPILRSCNPFVHDPRLTPLSEPAPYWVAYFSQPETEIETRVALTATASGRLNAVQLITKAVLTPTLDAPDNDWYLFTLQVPMPEREVTAGETLWLRVSYAAGCDLDALDLSWAEADESD